MGFAIQIEMQSFLAIGPKDRDIDTTVLQWCFVT